MKKIIVLFRIVFYCFDFLKNPFDKAFRIFYINRIIAKQELDMNMNPIFLMPISRTKLAKIYQVDLKTFNSWIKYIKGLKLSRRHRVLNPKQLMMIYQHIGMPDVKRFKDISGK